MKTINIVIIEIIIFNLLAILNGMIFDNNRFKILDPSNG